MTVIFGISGREAMPIRAIPFVTGWSMSPDMVASSLAHTDLVTKLRGISAYHLAGNDEPAPMLPKEWDGVEAELQALSDTLKADEVVDFELYPTWRRESILLLPAGVFVWKDEFITAFARAYSEERMGILDERPGDRELNLTPLIPQALREAVVEGFSSVEKLAVKAQGDHQCVANADTGQPPLTSLDKEDLLGTIERKTLLTIIAAMAVKGLKLNIDSPGKAAVYISGLTDELGAHVSKRAIEDHLKRIPDALETRMK